MLFAFDYLFRNVRIGSNKTIYVYCKQQQNHSHEKYAPRMNDYEPKMEIQCPKFICNLFSSRFSVIVPKRISSIFGFGMQSISVAKINATIFEWLRNYYWPQWICSEFPLKCTVSSVWIKRFDFADAIGLPLAHSIRISIYSGVWLRKYANSFNNGSLHKKRPNTMAKHKIMFN